MKCNKLEEESNKAKKKSIGHRKMNSTAQTSYYMEYQRVNMRKARKGID